MADTDLKKYLTTSQAAKILSVSPDTVLKWVKAGKIKSYRTLGGHFRIPSEALGLSNQKSELLPGVSSSPTESPIHIYCWEYLAANGDINSDCLECVTYRSRARRCYELRDLPGNFGCARMMCESECNQCDYYKLVNGQGINILVLSKSQSIIRDLHILEENKDFHIEFVDNEYKASMIIQNFRPDYVLVDCSLGKKQSGSICSNLFDDPRIPLARIILASKRQNISDYCEKEVFGWIKKPFTLKQLKDCIQGVPQVNRIKTV